MRNRRFVSFIFVFLTIFSLYYLSFSVVSFNIQKKANKCAMDSLGNVDYLKKQNYLDSMWNTVVYKFLGFSYTYEDVKERELALGLDLQGGMQVTLQVDIGEILSKLSNNNKPLAFIRALEQAGKEVNNNPNLSFIHSFYSFYKRNKSVPKLYELFNSCTAINQYGNKLSDSKVLKILESEVDQSMKRVVQVINARIDKFGTSQPNIQHIRGTNRIQIELPGVNNPERLKNILKSVAQLKFWEVYDSQELVNVIKDINEKDVARRNVLTAERKNSPILELNHGDMIYRVSDKETIDKFFAQDYIQKCLPVNLKWCWSAKTRKIKIHNELVDVIKLHALKEVYSKPLLEGNVIVDSFVDTDSQGNPVVSVKMTSRGAVLWRKITSSHIDKQIAITLDDRVYSDPVVNCEIPGGVMQISGNFTAVEAQDLASVLKAGSMPVSVSIAEEGIIGPSLGQKAISQGLFSMYIGLALVIFFMVVYYAFGGIIVSTVLLFNLLFILGFFAQLGSALTMPGIAGIVLTIGMSIDANVLVFERIREELACGVEIAEAVNRGYRRAFSSIFDSNFTTFLIGVILYYFAQGPIKGFATTLIIGIISSFFTAVYVSRVFIDIFNVKNFSISWLSPKIREFNFNFIKNRFKAYFFSFVFIVLGFVFIFRKGLSVGVDFTGGRSYVVNFNRAVDPEFLRKQMSLLFLDSSSEIKTYGSSNVLRITTNYLVNNTSEEIEKNIKSLLYKAIKNAYCSADSEGESINEQANKDFSIVQSSRVGASIASHIQISSLKSILGALLVIFIYIIFRFRKWQFGLAAVIALVHDILAIFATLGIAKFLKFNLEIDQVFVASVLTIIGYSINDTVVIFDRVRELLQKDKSFFSVVNKAINDTISRTTITSFTTLISVVFLVIFGGKTLQNFSVSMLVGILFGTYSSIFIAMPLVADFIREKKQD